MGWLTHEKKADNVTSIHSIPICAIPLDSIPMFRSVELAINNIKLNVTFFL